MHISAFIKQTGNVLRPIIVSACSFICTIVVLETIFRTFTPHFTLLASRGIGKFAFMGIALAFIVQFVLSQSRSYQTTVRHASFFWHLDRRRIATLVAYAVLFFGLHALVLAGLYTHGALNCSLSSITWSYKLLINCMLAIGVTFLLAWSEETIFRNVIYNYFVQYLPMLGSVLVTSFLFMIVHNLTQPLALLTSDWQLGLGLFLLGVLLNMLYVLTGEIAAPMGAHMGLVSLKVILRRIPCITHLGTVQSDLRTSHITHVLFMIIIIGLISVYCYHTHPRSSTETREP